MTCPIEYSEGRGGAADLHGKVLYTSGYTDSIATLQAIRASSADFIQKPYTPDSLARKVRDVLDARLSASVVTG